ncbi:ATP-binding protein [Olivibacter sp. XZL3]|uniref:ATP-binding protein n=1 Tax=Olivibacter sp. XZL3 TaxID=1735116 RepID=UPI0010655103|nr:ATP-binding protein [Olivibacter sp. XZL3]
MEQSSYEPSANELATQLADMRKLQAISAKLIVENNVDKLYQEILDAAIDLLRSDMGSMQILFPERNELALLAEKGFHPLSASFWKVVTLDSASTCGKALALGRRVVASDVEDCEFLSGTEDLHFYRLSDIRSVQTTPLISRSGKVVGMISTHWKEAHRPTAYHLSLLDVLARQAADVIERRKAEEALKESEERLRMAVKAGAVGTFIWNLEKDSFRPDAQLLSLFGLPPTTPNPRQALQNIIHPDDRNCYLAKAADKAKSLYTAGALEEDIRIVLPSGAIRWICVNAQACFSESISQSYVAGCVTDITNRKTVEQHKDEFISVASHELKTPVTSIKAYAQLLQQQFQQDPTKINFQILSKLGKQTDRLVKLIYDLLDTTKVMDGQLRLHIEKVDLNPIIADYVSELQSLTEEHDLFFEAGSIHAALADKDRVGQVLMNLVSNAIKYSPAGGRIKISTTMTENDYVRISVADEGKGIAEDQKAKIFGRFYRATDSHKLGLPSLGLGLYICAAIVKQHQGHIGLESKEGMGSVFYFDLPTAR